MKAIEDAYEIERLASHLLVLDRLDEVTAADAPLWVTAGVKAYLSSLSSAAEQMNEDHRRLFDRHGLHKFVEEWGATP